MQYLISYSTPGDPGQYDKKSSQEGGTAPGCMSWNQVEKGLQGMRESSVMSGEAE